MFGLTSSGKTGLSLNSPLATAQGRRPVVLDADSRQVYRYLDIGTSKISRAEMRGVDTGCSASSAHHSPPRSSGTRVTPAAVLDDLLGDGGAVPIVVGGTGTYVHAVVDGSGGLFGNVDNAPRPLAGEIPRSEVGEAHRI